MSQLGHLRKSAFAIGMSDVPSGTGIVRTSAQVRLMPIVAKVFLWWRTKLLRAADASYARRREGPYRFTKSRSRTSNLLVDGRIEMRVTVLPVMVPRGDLGQRCGLSGLPLIADIVRRQTQV